MLIAYILCQNEELWEIQKCIVSSTGMCYTFLKLSLFSSGSLGFNSRTTFVIYNILTFHIVKKKKQKSSHSYLLGVTFVYLFSNSIQLLLNFINLMVVKYLFTETLLLQECPKESKQMCPQCKTYVCHLAAQNE